MGDTLAHPETPVLQSDSRVCVERAERVVSAERKPGTDAFRQFDAYRETKILASEIAASRGLHEDIVFSDAMHVAVALRLEDEGLPYTKQNAAWMFARISPSEVRALLMFRRDHPADYRSLPKAGVLESLSAACREAASALSETLSPDRLNALFFGDAVGNA